MTSGTSFNKETDQICLVDVPPMCTQKTAKNGIRNTKGKKKGS